MKKIFFPFVAMVMYLSGQPGFSQTDKKTEKSEKDVPELGLPGDNLDLYAVLEVFQKSKTIEAFEKTLNDEKEKINNLDLNLDKKVDFIKIVTKKDGESYTFILQVDVSKNEKQDVAIILLDRDKDKKVSLQIVGDEELYGKDYVVEPKGNSSITANPGYVGEDPVTKDVPATTTVVVQSAPIVQYVYSPAYVPYYPPYYYGYYPPYFAFATVMAVGIYRHNHYHYHGGYHGGHYGGGNNVVINNRNSVNHYNNNSRNRSSTVSDNMSRGNYGNNRSGTGASGNRPSAGTSNRPSTGSSANRPSAGTSNRPSTGASASTRPSTGTSNRPSAGTSASSRPSSSSSGSSNRASSSSYSGGGRSMSSGGGMRSGGGGGGGRRR
jgi:hypothetical protein